VNGRKLDLVVANECTNDNELSPTATACGVLLARRRNFPASGVHGTGGYYADSVAVVDVNGDGKLDIVVANQCADAVARTQTWAYCWATETETSRRP